MLEKLNPKYPEIIEREFRKAADVPIGTRIVVDFPEDEEVINVYVDGIHWVMHVGSDDDNFYFINELEDVLEFDFPQDWIDLEESGPWES